jgi:cytochrome c peroxidase
MRGLSSVVLFIGLACRADGGRERQVPKLEQPATASSRAFYASTFSRTPSAAELAALGALLFRDPSLSASNKLACATCHDPARAFGPPTDAVVMRGGVDGKRVGMRAVPTLRYLQTIPRFSAHYHGADDDAAGDDGPAGGLTWDGRAQTAHDQALAPLFSPLEMALASRDELMAKLRASAYADRLRAAFGDDVLATAESATKAATLALEVYQQDPQTFYPYTSKFDAVLRGRATLSEREARGKTLFDDPVKGNCASCHPDTTTNGFPAFTDFGYQALGVPRNRALPVNADPKFFDLGLCGPLRTDLATEDKYCGMFRVPTLRNVATRRRFFHNGAIAGLDQAVAFYATRDTQPARWYPRGEAFDDVPARFRKNIHRDPPFGARPGDAPRLSPAEIGDVVAFLNTLTDGYAPPLPAPPAVHVRTTATAARARR